MGGLSDCGPRTVFRDPLDDLRTSVEIELPEERLHMYLDSAFEAVEAPRDLVIRESNGDELRDHRLSFGQAAPCVGFGDFAPENRGLRRPRKVHGISNWAVLHYPVFDLRALANPE